MAVTAALHARGEPEEPDPLLAHAPRVLLYWPAESGDRLWATRRGTLLLLDISGFTSLSERLAATGKAGVEEVTSLVSGIFTAFLEAAYEDNGSLLKFGGDALLLLFDGDHHASRAARAALRMRERLARVGRPQTSLGHVDLRMTTALSSGEVTLLLVGSSHRELVIAGPPAARVVSMEKAAAPGEILVDDATAELLGGAELGEGRDGARPLLGGVVAPPLPGPHALEPPLDPRPYIPTGLREALAEGTLEGEHRRAAVAFVAFGGLTRLLERAGPDATSGVVDALMSTIQDACDEQGVCFRQCDIGADGGTVFLVAGAPRTTGHDEEALLRVVRRILDADQPLPVRAGINRGRVFAGVIGTPFRRTYAVMGDAVNVAARLCAHAAWEQALVTRPVLEESRAAYSATPVPPLDLKGKAVPVEALALGEMAGARQDPVAEADLPLVGRAAELAVLTGALDSAVAGRGSLVEIEAEAGMGKSRLLAALAARARAAGAAVHGVDCAPYESSTAYFAVRGLLRELLGITPDADSGAVDRQLRHRLEAFDPALVPMRPLLAAPLDVVIPSTPEVEQLGEAYRVRRLHDLVSTVFARLLPGPTLICIEDAHWMDQASSALLRHLADVSRLGPWLLCATRRPGDDGFVPDESTVLRRIQLHALAPEAAAELARAEANRLMLVPAEAEAMAARAGGNPLFLRELLLSTQGRQQEALPETVEAVITARLDRLADRDRRLLRSVAVLGRHFTERRVRRVLGADPDVTLDRGAWIRLAEFVDGDGRGRLHFRHDLFREVAYEGLSYRRRRALHQRVGLDEERSHRDPAQVAELLSLHFSRAEVHDKAWEYSLIAAQRARAKWANLEALEFYRRALSSGGRLESIGQRDLAAVWEAIGDVASLAGRFDEAAEAYEATPRVSAENRVRLLLKLGRVQEQLARYHECLQLADRALIASDRIADDTDRLTARAQLLLHIAGVHHRLGNHRLGVEFAERAVADAGEAGDEHSMAHGYSLLSLLHSVSGSPQRIRYRALAIPIFEKLGDLVRLGDAYNNAGIDEYFRGHWTEAMDYYRRAMDTRQRAGHLAGRALGINNIGEIHSDQGHLEEAEREFLEVRQLTTAIGYTMAIHVAEGNLGRVAARGGRFEEAEQLLAAALRGFTELDIRTFVLETRMRQAELALLRGDLDGAEALSAALLEETASDADQNVLRASLHRIRAAALARGGGLDEAARAVMHSLACAIDAEAGYELALSLRVKAGIGRRTAAVGVETDAAEAKRLLASLGVVWTPDLLAGVADADAAGAGAA